ncbi:N-acetylmuramoyl-L-alanine amidase [Clostridium sp. UBA3061]|uniref:N-acetylmuramoyl-L-alanine amidase family protein n=1 Tax=Clostridium sp. UBA3061 TaxID=1946353 RepID=UPI0032179F14
MANVTYQVYAGGRWLPNVTNLSDYAGIYGTPIQGVYANLDKGSIQYRTHTQNGDWLPWVSDRSDYAGILGKNVDGIQMKISGLSGYNVKYRAYVGGRWLPWVIGESDYAGIYGQSIEAIQVEIVSDSSSGSGNGYVNVTYQVYAGGKWLPNVTNLSDYAGILGSAIQGVYANLDKGSIQYRTHTQGGEWLPWVSDRSDYAGILGKNVDGIQMKISGLSGYNVKYRAYVGGRWLPWVVGLEDYAGIFGQPIEGIQVEIVSGNSSGSGDGDPVLPPVTGARKVFIDPGHGGSDPGAIGNGLNEKDVVLSISKKVGNILTKNGISVAYSRTSDTYVSLEGRAQQANSLGSSLFVSIHANSFAGAANGTECYTYPSADAKNKELSRNVSRAIANKFGIPNRGHKEEDFAVLRLTNMPAILVETAFISNASDANLLRNRQDDFATAIANEIIKYFGGSSTTPRTMNLGLGNKLGFDPYTLQANVNISHSETILKSDNLEISLSAELIQDEPSLPISTENAKKIANMDNPQEIFEGATGILLDMLPSAVTKELKIMFNGIEKIELSSGKVSFNIFTQELKIQGVEVATIIRPFDKVRVKESISVDYTFDLTKLIYGSLGLALFVLVATLLTPWPGDEAVAVIAFLGNVFNKLLTSN